VVAQEAGIQPGIEVIGVSELWHVLRQARHRRQEALLRRGERCGGILAQGVRMAVGSEPQPDLMKGDALDVRAELTELMEVAMAAASPIVKLDAELEARLRGANEVTLVDTEDFVVELQGRNGRLPHTDRPDLIGLDQGHAVR